MSKYRSKGCAAPVHRLIGRASPKKVQGKGVFFFFYQWGSMSKLVAADDLDFLPAPENFSTRVSWEVRETAAYVFDEQRNTITHWQHGSLWWDTYAIRHEGALYDITMPHCSMIMSYVSRCCCFHQSTYMYLLLRISEFTILVSPIHVMANVAKSFLCNNSMPQYDGNIDHWVLLRSSSLHSVTVKHK